MPWTVGAGLRIFAPCALITIGAALAEDSPPNAAEGPRVIEPRFNSIIDSEFYSVGIASAQDSPSPIAAQRPITSEYAAISDPLAYSNGVTSAQRPPPPIVVPRVASEPQHIAVSSYVDADSLGNRTVYADGRRFVLRREKG